MDIKENTKAKASKNDMKSNTDMQASEAALKVYRDLIDAMINKSEKKMQALLADNFNVNLMSALNLNKKGFINAVIGGTIKVYSVDMGTTDVTVKGDTAVVVGQSVADAAIVLKGRKNWQMILECKIVKMAAWQMTECKAKFQ